jgi:hypothetical protein
MTSNEKAEIDQIRRDLATLGRRILPSSGGKPDVIDVIERNSVGPEAVNYHAVAGRERTVA